MASNSNTSERDQSEILINFMDITGSDATEASSILLHSGWNLEAAVTRFFNLSTGNAQRSDKNRPRDPIPSKRQKLVEEYLPNHTFNASMQNMHASSRLVDAVGSENGYRRQSFRTAAINNNRKIKTLEFKTSKVGSNVSEKKVDLNALFSPPVDILFVGSFQAARRQALHENKFLLVNVQKQSEFASHQLNRDIWRDETLREVIACSYTFWMVYAKEPCGKQYIQNYKIQELPHVAIVDPRTGGEELVILSKKLIPLKYMIEKIHGFTEKQKNRRKRKRIVTKLHAQEGAKVSKREDKLVDSNVQSATLSKHEGSALTGKVSSTIKAAFYEVEQGDKASLSATLGGGLTCIQKDSEIVDGSEGNLTEVALKFPDGKRMTKKFKSRAKVNAIYDYVRLILGEKKTQFELRGVYPPRSLSENLDATIESMDIEGSSLMVKFCS